MNKKKISIIAVLMSLALVGVIVMQVNWILHDYHLKEQQFEQRVNDAMVSVAAKLETREAYNVFSNSFITFNNDSIFSLLREKKILEEQFAEEAAGYNEDGTPVAPPSPPSPIEPPLPPDFPDPLDFDHNDQIQMEISHMGGRKITIRHNSHVITIDDSLSKTEIRDNSDDETLESRELLDKQREKIEGKLSRWNTVMQNLAFEFITDEKDLAKRINQKQLDTLINTELQSRGIDLDYRFGVLHSGSKTILQTNSPRDTVELLNSAYKSDLFPNDILAKPIFLSLYFPQSVSYVLSTMWVMLISSSLFILVIVLGFAYTMHTLFRQKKLSDIKNDFINNMTHEFKTPIATISLATDAVGNPKIAEHPESVSRYMRIIKEENQRMHKHVEAILQMALLDKKNFQVNHEELNLHEIIKQAVEQIQLQVEVKEGTIEMNLNAERYEIIGDANLLFNSIMNLLDNANKYTPVKPLIIITTENTASYISVTVSDNGIGMSREVQKNIFEKFYRATSGNIHDVKGFGLGLSFVKAIAVAHKGDVKVIKSELSKGTTMQMMLPIDLNSIK